MENYPVRLFIVLLMALLFAPVSSIADSPEQFQITKSPQTHDHPAMAANSQGDVLVVWTQRPEDTTQVARAKMRFFTRASGYKGGPVQQLNPEYEDGYQPRVAFNPDYNRFIVTWSNVNPKLLSRPWEAVDLRFRSVSASGEMDKTVRKMRNSYFDYYPMPVALPRGAAAKSNAAFMIIFTRFAGMTYDHDSPGIWTMLVDKKGRRIEEPRQVFSSKTLALPGKEGGSLFAGSKANQALFIDKTQKLQIHLDLVYFDAESNLIVDTWLLTTNADGQRVNFMNVSGPTSQSTTITALSAKKFLVTWRTSGYPHVYNQIYRNNLTPVKKPFEPDPVTSSVAIAVTAKLGGDKGSYQVFINDTWLFGVYLNKNGNIKGPVHQLERHDGYIQDINAIAVPGSNDIFVVVKRWNKGIENLYGMVINPITDDLQPAADN